MEQVKINQAIKDINPADTYAFFRDLLLKILKDLGKKMTESDQDYIIEQVTEILKSRPAYKNWTLFNLKNCLENGKLGNYNKYGNISTITVAMVEQWLSQHNYTVQADAAQKEIELQKIRSLNTNSMLSENRNPIYAQAVLERMNRICDLSRQFNQNIQTPSQYYLSEKKRILSIKFDVLVDAIRNKNIKEVLK